MAGDVKTLVAREDTEVKAVSVQPRDNGEFYGVEWTDKKGKERRTWIDAKDMK